MKVHIQRVHSSSVKVDGTIVASISTGLLLFVGFCKGETDTTLDKMADKICNLRVFPSNEKNYHLSVLEAKAEVLSVPQFTLYGDCRKGRRPDFVAAMEPDKAEPLFRSFNCKLESILNRKIQAGIFGANMNVFIHNDGPSTFLLEL